MEGEYPAGSRRRIAHVPEESLIAGTLVVEDQLIRPACQVIRDGGHVTLGLVRDTTQGHAGLLGLDDASGLALDEQ